MEEIQTYLPYNRCKDPRGRTIEEHRVLLELKEKAYSMKNKIQKKKTKLNSRKVMSITLTNTRKIDK